MIVPNPSSRQLEQLFQDFEDGCLSADDHVRLMKLLDSDPGVRRAYLRHMSFVSAMHAEAEGRAKIHGVGEGLPVIEPPKRVVARSILIAAAVVALLAVIGMLITVPRQVRAKLAATPGAEWHFAAGGYDEAERDFLPGTRIVVEAGLVEMTSPGGTRVLLEGPADFVWRERKVARLRSGQAWFAVPKAEIGFTVELEGARVVDLGTEFGIRAMPAGSEVHVGVGKVRVEPIFGEIRSGELRAGEAVSADVVGHTHGIPCETERFVRRLPEVLPHIRWSFDRWENGGFVAESAGMPASPMALAFPNQGEGTPALIDGPFGSAVDLDATGAWLRSTYKGVPGSAPRTVAMWVKASGELPRLTPPGSATPRNHAIMGWGELESGAKWHLVTRPNGTSLSSVWGGSWKESSLPRGFSLCDGTWHHVVSVFTGVHSDQGIPEIRHYVDGQFVRIAATRASDPVNTEVSGANARTLTVGHLDTGFTEESFLPIQVDEVVVVRGALDDRQIDILFRENRLEFAPTR